MVYYRVKKRRMQSKNHFEYRCECNYLKICTCKFFSMRLKMIYSLVLLICVFSTNLGTCHEINQTISITVENLNFLPTMFLSIHGTKQNAKILLIGFIHLFNPLLNVIASFFCATVLFYLQAS